MLQRPEPRIVHMPKHLRTRLELHHTVNETTAQVKPQRPIVCGCVVGVEKSSSTSNFSRGCHVRRHVV
jgi:hypothetical protein